MARKLTAWQKHVKSEATRTGLTGAPLFKAASKTYKKTSKPAVTRAKRSNPKAKTMSKKRNSKLFRTISGAGALEDLGVGVAGGLIFRSLGYGVYAVPATRIVQGLAGMALDRRGKRHLVAGTIDFIDNWLLQQLGFGVGRSTISTPVSISNVLRPLKALRIMR